MSDIFEEDKISKPKKKKKPELSKSDTFGDNITSLSSDADVSDYLEDFLQHSKGAVFITGNDNINKTSSVKNKKMARKTVKKKKNAKSKNGYYIMNGIVPHSSDEEEKKEKEEKELFERLEREEQERKEKIEKEKLENERIENERKEKERIEKEEKERKEKEEREKKEREEKERKEKEEKERKEREERLRKEKEEKERKEKEEKERIEKEEKERIEKEEKERKEREEKERKEKEEKERKEKEEKERKEKEAKEREEKEKKMKEMKKEDKKKKKIIKRIPKIQIKKEKEKPKINIEDKKESDYSESPLKMLTQSNGEKSDNKNNNSDSDYNYAYNFGKDNSYETPVKNRLDNLKEEIVVKNLTSSDKKEITEEESEITEKISEKYLLSINNSNEESEEESEEEIEKEEIEKEDSGLEEAEENEEEKIEYKNESKSIINNNRIKINLNESLNKYVKGGNLISIEKYTQFIKLIQKKLINEINNILKSLYIFLKIKNYKVNSIIKIESTYRGFILRQKFKLDYLTSKILNLREEYASKISSYYRMLLSRRQTKKLLQKTADHYIIYSSLINNNQLYFKYKYQNGSDDNLYFEFCPILKCFILFIDKREKMNKKILEGCFYNENYNALIDPLYEKNSKGENVINFPKIFQKEDLADEAKEIIINRYIKLHRPIRRRRERIDDYEERKRKMIEEEHHSSIRLSSSQTLKYRRIGDKVKKISRSKSFMKLKGFMKSILKPSKSYINLKCESKKKIHFGSAKIKRYHNLKK